MTSAAAVSRESEAAANPDVVDAVGRAYDEHAPVIFRVLRRFGVPDAALDDAVQDVFVVACRRYAEFEGRSSLRTWLYGIARRVARDHRRSAQRDRSETPELDALRAGPDPGSVAEAAEAARLLDAALATASETLREVFVLVELEELSAPEIATILGVPLNTVYSRLRLARHHVQAFVRELHAQRRAQ